MIHLGWCVVKQINESFNHFDTNVFEYLYNNGKSLGIYAVIFEVIIDNL